MHNSLEIMCLPFLKERMENTEILHILGCIQREHLFNSENLSLLTMLHGYSFTPEDIENNASAECSYRCEDLVCKAGISPICKLCKCSTSYTQANIETEKKILYTCIASPNEACRLYQYLSDKYGEQTSEYVELLFNAHIQIATKGNSDIVVLPFYRVAFKCLCEYAEVNETGNVLDCLNSLDNSYSTDIIEYFRAELNFISSMKYKDEEIDDILTLADRILSNIPSNSENMNELSTHNDETEISSHTSDYTCIPDDDYFMDTIQWSVDIPAEEMQNDYSNEAISTLEESNEVLSSETMSEPNDTLENDTKHNPELCNNTNSYLTNDGYLYNVVEFPKETALKYTYITTTQQQLMFKYDILSNLDIAIEFVVWSENNVPGFLFYICEQHYFYFLPLNINTSIIRSCLKGLFSDAERKVYTMISLPVFYHIYKLDYEEVNIIPLYDMYTVINGEPCIEPYNIIRSVSNEFNVTANEYIPFCMQFYRNVFRKYIHRFNDKQWKLLSLTNNRNHILAMSYKLVNLCNFKSIYIRLNINGQYEFLSKQLKNYSLTKAGKKISASYSNLVDNHSRYSAAFYMVLSKMYTSKLHKSCQFVVLDLTDEKMVLFVEDTSEDTFMSAFKHLLVRAGQQFISDIPDINISVSI